jgi:pimeloyl-ACP methyl ester carboxylesterase
MTGSSTSTRIPGQTGVMDRARLDGVELEYQVVGSGEAVLLIPPGPLADGFLPFLSQEILTNRYSLVQYHRRGQASSSPPAPPSSYAEQAADAAGLLGHLGISRAHVVGHSTGANLALQLALDRPELVQTLVLLEPWMTASPSAPAFFAQAAAPMEAYGSGEKELAMAGLISLASGLDWDTSRAVIDEYVPGSVAQAIKDADTFCGVDLPALSAWEFGPQEAAAVSQHVLSVLGSDSQQLFVEGAALLRSWLPEVEDLIVEGAGHLLQIQRPQPVARGMAEFLGRHPIKVQAWPAVASGGASNGPRRRAGRPPRPNAARSTAPGAED